MTDKTTAHSGSTPVAVLHRAGDVVHGVVGTPGAAATIASWRQMPAHDTDGIRAWLDEAGPVAVLTVLPASMVVCRTCTLPDAAQEQLDRALALQAEAHLLNGLPDHRQARAVLPIAPGETSRSGIMVAWPQAGTDDWLRSVQEAAPEVRFIPDVAALAALLDGKRPQGPLLYFDPGDGSVALVFSHPHGAVFRAARVATDSGHLAEAIGRVVAETALSVNHTARFTETLVAETTRRIRDLDGRAALVVPSEVIDSAAARLQGAPDDPEWWRQYGVAAGALLAAGGPLAPLGRLQLDAPTVSPSLGRQLIELLSRPRNAAWTVAVCLVIIVLGPLLVSGLKLGLLRVRLPDLDANLREAKQAEVQLAMYRELKDHAWPMTKLLADIACCTPRSLDIDQIRIQHGKSVNLTGTAKKDGERNLTAQEVVALMQDNLRTTGIFDEIYVEWRDPNNFDAYEFTIKAKVINPYRAHKYPEELDYAARTLANRLYGDAEPPGLEPAAVLTSDERENSPMQEEIRPPGEQPDEKPVNGTNSSRPRSRGGISPPGGRAGAAGPGFRGSDRAITGGAIPMSQDIPEPLTPEEIAVMNLPDLQEHLTHLSQAIQQARVDEETKTRLWTDWKLVLKRKRELIKSSGDAP